jgi:hypothetical protein
MPSKHSKYFAHTYPNSRTVELKTTQQVAKTPGCLLFRGALDTARDKEDKA